jgi:hypothetical protein
MKRVLPSIIFILTAVMLISFLSIDACMDSGGMWSNYGFTCTTDNPEFIPQYKRTAPFFWGIVILFSAIPSLIIHKVLSNAKP